MVSQQDPGGCKGLSMLVQLADNAGFFTCWKKDKTQHLLLKTGKEIYLWRVYMWKWHMSSSDSYFES